jgi:6-pyruvoyltetrahydropterin/6-carboxytetrahydropterin synthase
LAYSAKALFFCADEARRSPITGKSYNGSWDFPARNGMYEVTVEAGFSSGHYLRNYKGKCENPHGHNYRVMVTLQGETLDKAGLLLDFKDLKLVMRPVVDRLDHQMINDLAPFTELNPSAENLSRYFFDETSRQLLEMTEGRVRVKDCTVFETDTSWAKYYE